MGPSTQPLAAGSDRSKTWLSDRGILLHIGPPKTGTTALQSSLFAARFPLNEQGLRYPIRKEKGRRLTQHGYAAAALMGLQRQGASSVESLNVWDALVRKVHNRPDRALLSAELFADAQPEHIEKITSDLGTSNLQVLITLRPLSNMLASTWQQDLKGGRPQSYNDWLIERLEGPRDTPFWYRNAHDDLVQRWVSQLGPERVAVLAADSRQPDSLLRDFESVAGIEAGTLTPKKGNRSLTVAETELFRQVLERVDDGDDPVTFHRLVRSGGLRGMVERRQPPATEQRLTSPAWAAAKAHEIHQPMIENIGRMGVPVFGDISILTDPLDETGIRLSEIGSTDEQTPTMVPIAAAAELALGIYRAASREQQLAGEDPTTDSEPVKSSGLRDRLANPFGRKTRG